jgi:SAM-dependent methyltransferase
MSDEPTRVVQAGYDAIAPRFLAWSARVKGDPRDRVLGELTSRLPDGARVLDLGCGAGVPTRRLAERFEVTGVDISEAQLALARADVPRATFLQADIAKLELEGGSFDAVTAFYAISHVPREKHADLFARIARYLAPGGFFLASLGARGSEDWTGKWLGVEMFFSSYDADSNRRLLGTAGLELVLDEIVTMQEPEGPATFLWVLVRKPS